MCQCLDEEALAVPFPTHRARHRAPACIGDALLDLRNEGLGQLDEIAAFYNLKPALLLRAYHGGQYNAQDQS